MRLLSVLVLAVAAAGCARPAEKDGPTVAAATDAGVAVKQIWPANAPVNAPNAAAKTWNAANIEWHDYADGVRSAKAQNKPILLVVYTSWCPHCKNYSHVFDDPRVVEKAKGFVMVKIDSDDEPEVAHRYARDGGYIPRTYFLAPDGTANAAIHAPRSPYQFFYDERNAGELLASMDAELQARQL